KFPDMQIIIGNNETFYSLCVCFALHLLKQNNYIKCNQNLQGCKFQSIIPCVDYVTGNNLHGMNSYVNNINYSCNIK
ncbi:MAG: hypothetical protein KAI79_07020, partial [Bacteroidales bacterium]|nr:hypothetical protein [Bacteroidales bacterium]